MTKPYRKRRLWLSVPGAGASEYYPVVLSTEKALLYRFTGRWQDAEQLLRECVAWVMRGSDRAARIEAQRNLSGLLIYRGAFDEAQDLAVRSMAECQATGDRRNYSRFLEHLGSIHTGRGSFEQALACYAESLAIADVETAFTNLKRFLTER